MTRHPNFHAVKFATDIQIKLYQNKFISDNEIKEAYISSLRNKKVKNLEDLAVDVIILAREFIIQGSYGSDIIEFTNLVENLVDQAVLHYERGERNGQ